MVSDKCLHLSRKVFFQSFHIPWAIQKERTSVNKFLYHVVLVDVGRIMACYKVCLLNQVCGLNRFLSKTKVGHRHTAGFFGIIIKVCLCIHICIVTNDLDRVLICSNSTISTKSPELTVDCSFWCSNKCFALIQWQVCYVINDTDCESFFFCVVVYSNDLSRCRIFGT